MRSFYQAKREVLWVVAGALLFLCGFVSGLLFQRNFSFMGNALPAGQEVRMKGYTYINPLLECEPSGDPEGYTELRPFKREVEAYISKQMEKERSLVRISVYFRQLNYGPWFGINEDDTFAPASMLKVPVMIALLKEAEGDPSILNKRVKYEAKDAVSLEQNIVPEIKLEKGHSYTLDELLRRSIVYSDNAADDLLLREIGPADFNAVLADLSGKTITSATPDDFMTVHEYASFFRMLFNASYLDKRMSERALSYLSGTRFNNGIVAGVPAGTVVAHKFGERVLGETAGVTELHDCGIVYYPNDPYLLCIMTKGEDPALLDKEIRDVSAIVYSKYDNSHKTRGVSTFN